MALPVYHGACGRCSAVGFVGLLRSGDSIALVCQPCFDAGATTPPRVTVPRDWPPPPRTAPTSSRCYGPVLYVIGGVVFLIAAAFQLVIR